MLHRDIWEGDLSVWASAYKVVIEVFGLNNWLKESQQRKASQECQHNAEEQIEWMMKKSPFYLASRRLLVKKLD